jgi:hypothetical protein
MSRARRVRGLSKVSTRIVHRRDKAGPHHVKIGPVSVPHRIVQERASRIAKRRATIVPRRVSTIVRGLATIALARASRIVRGLAPIATPAHRGQSAPRRGRTSVLARMKRANESRRPRQAKARDPPRTWSNREHRRFATANRCPCATATTMSWTTAASPTSKHPS